MTSFFLSMPAKISSIPVAVTLRHPSPIIYAHWLSVLALAVVFTLVIWRDWIDEDALRATLLNGHRLFGLVVGSLAIIRLLVRSRYAMAPTHAAQPRLQRLAAELSHGLVYVLLLSLPMLGWLLTNARGQAVSLAGRITLPRLLAQDLDLADTLETVHGTVAWGLAALIALHLLAVVWHHWVRRDKVLVAMLPGLR